MTGVCAGHQRWLGVAIKRARNIALLPFAGSAAGTQAPRVVVPGAAAGHAAPAAPVAAAPAASAPAAGKGAPKAEDPAGKRNKSPENNLANYSLGKDRKNGAPQRRCHPEAGDSSEIFLCPSTCH